MSSQGERHRRRRIRKLRLLALLVVLGLVGSASFAYGLVTALASEIPKLDPARYHPDKNSYVYTSDGRVLAVLRGDEARIVVKSDEISDLMKQAIVAVEDRRFFEHRGVDVRGIVRAVWQDLRNRAVVEGGSTITQQFVKNAYVHSSRTVERKLKEAALAWQLEQRWPKDRILTAYLNTIYFGNGAYGIEQASRVYFQHSADRLTLAESALLAGIPADPTLYDPAANPQQARARRKVVLRDMLQQGAITWGEFKRANAKPLPDPASIHLPGIQGPAPYFTNYVKQQLIDTYGTARVFGGGLRVRTSIDLDLQDMAREAIAKWLPDPNGPAAALVAIDPRDGRVLAMSAGGTTARASSTSPSRVRGSPGRRSSRSRSRPRSTRASPRRRRSSRARSTISLGTGYWHVENYEGSNLGTIDLETATTYSDNTVYAQLTDSSGRRRSREWRAKLGITSRLKGYFSLTLGGEAVNPLEMARAYASLANSGQRIDGSLMGNQPRAVLRVGKKANVPVAETQALGDNEAAIETRLLQERGRERHRTARPAFRRTAGRRQDRHDGELRRRLVRRLHAAARGRGLGRLPGPPAADAHRVPRRSCRRRHVSGVDLQGVHGEGADRSWTPSPRGSRRRPTRTRRRGESSSATGAGGSTTATAGARGSSSTSRAKAPTRPGTASRTRSTCRT